ncbi:MAG: hypothetical protein HY787_23645 [Deltaproteobacteria bacterium]|nr:hypothetical protein [Deltaproteobacteria bacterium]
MLSQLCDVVTDYELKWKPPYELAEVHVAIDDPNFSFNNFFDKLEDFPIKGSKLTFDFDNIKNWTQGISACLPSTMAIIHLTRSYYQVLNSLYKGIYHHYNHPNTLSLKSPIIHKALMRSNNDFFFTRVKPIEERKRFIPIDDARKQLDVFLSVDEWASSLSVRNPYFRIDYSQINDRFFKVARFLGSTEQKDRILEIVNSPPTEKLPQEKIIINHLEISQLAKRYDHRKGFLFWESRLKKLLRMK